MADSDVSSLANSVITFYWEKDGDALCPREDGCIENVPQVDLVHSQQCNSDRGLLAWRVVLGGFCCTLCSFGWINCKLRLLTLKVADMI